MGLLGRLTAWLQPNSERAGEAGAGGPSGGPQPVADDVARPDGEDAAPPEAGSGDSPTDRS